MTNGERDIWIAVFAAKLGERSATAGDVALAADFATIAVETLANVVERQHDRPLLAVFGSEAAIRRALE